MNNKRCSWYAIILGWAFVLFFSSSVYGDPSIKIGVLAYRGIEKCYQMWNSTAEYLSREIPGSVFEIVPLNFDVLPLVIKNNQIDFVITNSSSYVDLEAQSHITRIATLKNRILKKGYAFFGGVIFTRADRTDLTDLGTLRGKKFMAVDPTSFGGYQMAWYEMKEYGINPGNDFSSLEFGGTHDAVILAVKEGRVDAGTVRTDTLERMAATGKINLNEFRLIPTPHSEHEEDVFPFLHSTRLYPEWPFARTRHASEAISTKVAIALLKMPPDSIMASDSESMGWTIPMDYQPVQDCMRSLGIGCYKDFGKITLLDIIKNYGYWILCIAILLLWALKANVRLSSSEQNLQNKIVEKEETESKFRHLSNQNILILNSIKEGLLGLDVSGKHTFVNPAASVLLGYSVEELLNMASHDTWHHATFDGKIFPVDKCPIMKTIVEGIAIHDSETVFWRKNNSPFPVEFSSLPILEDSRIIGAVISFRDISLRKMIEKALRESEEKFRAISVWAYDAIIMIDDQDLICYWNPAAKKILGFTEDEIIGMAFPEAIMPHQSRLRFSGHFPKWRDAAFGNDAGKAIELKACKKDGTEIDAEITLSSFEMSNTRHAICILRDISERKKFQRQLQRATDKAVEANQTKSRFLATMSHELRTPLNSIIGFSEMLQEEAIEMGQDNCGKDLGKIISSAGHLMDIINDILDLSKIESGKMKLNYEKIKIEELIKSVFAFIAPLAKQNSNTATFEFRQRFVDIETDQLRLRQILLNLIGNSCKFTQNGSISLTMECCIMQEKEMISFSIRDTGIGMTGDQIGRLFLEFSQGDSSTTRKYGGTGLGLAIAKRIICLMGGDITVESELGKGSVFTFRIPATAAHSSLICDDQHDSKSIARIDG
ncbi:MAG: PhnD/SsuA/transferrin family substrate-binding protein [Candidatus Riflebacteria bacterium]|nr:PhnD/SsuA/transferrin family substrate-binding protein [Candidatus Riflebacteria bacterium]